VSTIKKVIGSLFALALMVVLFAGSGMEVNATSVSDNTIVDGTAEDNQTLVNTETQNTTQSNETEANLNSVNLLSSSEPLNEGEQGTTFSYTVRYMPTGSSEPWFEKTVTIENAKNGDTITLEPGYYDDYQLKTVEMDLNAFNNNGTVSIKNVTAEGAYINYIYEPLDVPTGTIKVEVTYYYIDGNGNNKMYVDTTTVEGGSTWGDFFKAYTPCYQNGELSNVNSNNSWKIAVQNTSYSDITDCYSKIVRNFNMYCDAAFVTYYGMPCDYKHAYFAFEALQDGEYIDSGTGWDFLIPSAYAYGSAEAIEYAKKSLEMHDYIMDYCNAPGAEWTITAPYTPKEGMWDGYIVTINLPSGSTKKHSSDDSDSEKVVQTPENNYGVFQESVKTSIDVAIAQAAASGNGAAPITIDTGIWISFKGDVYQKLQDSGLPVQITFRYQGIRYRVDIPAGADLMSLVDENGYCGFLNLMAHFGGTVL